MKLFGSRERLAWTAVTVVLLAGLAFFALSPRLAAGGPEEETQAYLANIGDVFDEVRANYVDASVATPKALYEGAMKGMFEALGDPYSMFLDSSDWADLNDVSVGTFGGVGLQITKVDKVGVRIMTAYEDGPSYKAGITAGDVITAVDGKPIGDLAVNAVRDLLRGTPKTAVTMTVKRGDSIQFDATVTREIITVNTVKYAMLPSGIGYVSIEEFTPQTADKVREALASLKAQGYTALVIDLRGDRGGLLGASVDVANLFIDQGLIVESRSPREAGGTIRYTARRGRMVVDPKVPVVVLVDHDTASASEILSGALKDYGRAVLYGTTTYGKGSVQNVRAIGDGGYRYTVARYYTPAGAATNTSIDKKGILPDRVIEEPALTDAQTKSLNDLLNGTQVRDFLKATPKPTEADLQAFFADLRKKGIALDDRYLRRLVVNQQNMTVNNPPPFDLDYDIVLQAAVKALQAHEVTPKAP